MARLNAQQAATFPTSSGSSDFLKLQDDGDSVVVRFAYSSTEEMMGCDTVHQVKDPEGKYITVDCLKTDYSNPDSVCPLCASGVKLQKVYYLQCRNEETGEMQVWQRSDGFVRNNLLPLLQDYEADGILPTMLPIKIVRNGKKGDMHTKYTLVPKAYDQMTLDQFPEDIDVRAKGIVKELNFMQMQTFVQTGQLPQTEDNSNVQGVQGQQQGRGYVAQQPVQSTQQQYAERPRTRGAGTRSSGY
jgi:hypothetical protein